MANRCLYIASFKDFLEQERLSVLGSLHNNYHGDALTTTDEAWMGEIDILQKILIPWKEENAQVIFEYEIPRLGKRIDVVLLLRGIIFCLEFKVGQKVATIGEYHRVWSLNHRHSFLHCVVLMSDGIMQNLSNAIIVILFYNVRKKRSTWQNPLIKISDFGKSCIHSQ